MTLQELLEVIDYDMPLVICGSTRRIDNSIVETSWIECCKDDFFQLQQYKKYHKFLKQEVVHIIESAQESGAPCLEIDVKSIRE